jgi:chitin synthase
LRKLASGTKPEIFIVLTLSDENQDVFLKTWNALQRNIQYLCQKKNSEKWGVNGINFFDQGWQKIAICIIGDGRRLINKKTLAILGLLGLYQEGLVTTSIEDKPVSAHLFEYTTQVRVDSSYIIERASSDVFPMQVILFLKEEVNI